MNAVGTLVMKAIVAMGLKMLTESAIEDLFLWSAKAIASRTSTKVDDQLVALIEKHITGVDPADQVDAEGANG